MLVVGLGLMSRLAEECCPLVIGLGLMSRLTEECCPQLLVIGLGQFSVVITQQQEQALRRQLNTVFWIVWILMITCYFVQTNFLTNFIKHPDNEYIYVYMTFGYVVTLTIFYLISTITEAIYRGKTSEQHSWASMLWWTVLEFCKRIAVFVFWWVFYGMLVMDAVFYFYDSEGRAGIGDTNYQWSRTFVDALYHDNQI